MIFDLLHAGRQSLLNRPYMERRTQLNEVDPAGPAWQTPPLWIGGGADILAATAEQGLEGIIAKRVASTYQPGRRSPAWRKIKNIRTVDVLIGGWSPGGGRRTGTIGSLLVGVSTPDGLAYIGNVGTGFTDAALRDLLRRIATLEIPASPFDAVPVPHEFARLARWVRLRRSGGAPISVVAPDRRDDGDQPGAGPPSGGHHLSMRGGAVDVRAQAWDLGERALRKKADSCVRLAGLQPRSRPR